MATQPTLSAKQLAIEAARIARDNRAEDAVVLDLGEISPVTDYFVVCTGTSGRQMKTVADEIERHGASHGQKVWHVEGLDSGAWVLLDFVDVVIHIFDRTHRSYYDLELIWGEAPRVDWQEDAPGPRGEKAEQ